MSYGISFKVKTKQEALEQIASQVETILKGQPEHMVDVPKVADTLRSAVDGLDLKDGQVIACHTYGSISRTWPVQPGQTQSLVSVSATISIGAVFDKPQDVA